MPENAQSAQCQLQAEKVEAEGTTQLCSGTAGEKENILFTWIEWIKDQPEMQPPQRPSPKIDDRDYMQGLASQYMDLGEMDLDNFRKLYLGKQSGTWIRVPCREIGEIKN